MARVYISIGSNIDREANIKRAIHTLRRYFGPLDLSTVYETEPVGLEADNFYNLAAGFDTDLDVYELIERLHEIENRHGRTRPSSGFVSRTLDLDLLLYDDRVIHKKGLDLPREDITEYAFVLRPLSEIAGETVHPETGDRLADLWKSYKGPECAMQPIEIEMD